MRVLISVPQETNGTQPRVCMRFCRLKHFAHPDIDEFRKEHLKPNFREVHYLKPGSSRSESSEAYFLCRGWCGDNGFGLL